MNEEQQISTDTPIKITPLAVEKLKEHAKNDNKNIDNIVLRVFVQGGGCSGLQDGLMFNEDTGGEIGSGDKSFELNGVKIVIDFISIKYLNGATIDFVKQINGGGLIIKNPNARSICNCGQSFNTDENNSQ